jgi:hypothetical protein
MRVWSRGRTSTNRTSRAAVAALASLLAVAAASAAEMEVDSTAVITQYDNGKSVATFDESAVNFFDTLAPPGGYGQFGPPLKMLYFDPSGNISGFAFSVPGFSTFANGNDTGVSDPGLRSAAFNVAWQFAVSGLRFNPISQSTYLSSPDPWALFFNGATFEANDSFGMVCYEQWCTSGGNPATWVGTDYRVSFSGTIHAVPEPGTFGLGLAAIVLALRRNPLNAQSRRPPFTEQPTRPS